MTAYEHVSTTALEAIMEATGRPIERDPMTDRRSIRIGSTEFWARPDVDVVAVPVVGRAR